MSLFNNQNLNENINITTNITDGEAMGHMTGNPDTTNELEELKQYVRDYNATITAKMDGLEENLTAFEEENSRLRTLKDCLSVERDSCIGLIARLAQQAGYKVGKTTASTVAVDLPSGQVSWQYEASEAHLFEGLPDYEGTIEELDIIEKYRRVMNPGI